MDDYLSCIHIIYSAVQYLCYDFTKLYEETGRKVLLALAGDHAPSFVDHVADKTRTEGNDLQSLERSTPFFISKDRPAANRSVCLGSQQVINTCQPLMWFNTKSCRLGSSSLSTSSSSATGCSPVISRSKDASDSLHASTTDRCCP